MAIIEPNIEIIKQLKVKPTVGEWKLLNYLIKNLDSSYVIYYQLFLNGDNPDFANLIKADS